MIGNSMTKITFKVKDVVLINGTELTLSLEDAKSIYRSMEPLMVYEKPLIVEKAKPVNLEPEDGWTWWRIGGPV